MSAPRPSSAVWRSSWGLDPIAPSPGSAPGRSDPSRLAAPAAAAALWTGALFGQSLGSDDATLRQLGAVPETLSTLAWALPPLAAALWLAALHTRRPATMLALALAALAVGGALGGVAARPGPLHSLLDAPGGAEAHRWVRGTLAREPVSGPTGSRFLLRVATVRLDRSWVDLPGLVEVQVADAPPRDWYPGRRLEAFLRLRPDRPAANPGVPRRDRLRDRGLDLRGNLKLFVQARAGPPAAGWHTLPARLRNALRASIAGRFDHAGLLRALLLGERDAMPDRFWQDLGRAGLLHLLAISGLHVGLLAGTVVLGCRTLGAGPRLAALGGLACLGFLLLVVEPRAPVQRAAVMGVVLLACRTMGLRVRGIDALAAAVLLLLAREPLIAGQLGFQLTTAATLGLLLGAGSTTGALAGATRASVVAQLSVAPLIARRTWRIVPAGVLWNLLALPLVAAALPVAALATGLGALADRLHGSGSALLPAAGAVPATAAAGMTEILEGAAGGLGAATDFLLALFVRLTVAAANSFDPIVVPSPTPMLAAIFWLGLGTVLLGGGPRVRVAGLALLLASGLSATRSPAPPAAAEMTLFDVGQGDAILIRAGSRTILYDTGGFPGIDYDVGHHVVAPQLRRHGIRRLDALAISHAHADHAAGARALLRDPGADELWVGSHPVDAGLGLDLLRAARATGATALAPRRPRALGSCRWRPWLPGDAALRRGARKVTNRSSLVLELTCAGRSLLLAGDADRAAEADWLAAGLDAPPAGPALLKVGHHGSDTSTGPELLRALRARHAFISVGARNPWGLPRSSVVRRLRAAGASVYRTDRDGALTVSLGTRIRVHGERWRVGR